MLATILAALAPAWGWIIAGGGIVLSLVGVWLHGRSVGVADEQAARAQQRLDAIEESRKVAGTVDALPASDVDKRLTPFMRD